MPLSSNLVGATGETRVQDVDARWTMAYAAALGDMLPCYVDTRRPGGVVAHPLFPVCFEWPLVVAGRDLAGTDLLSAEDRMRAVHATHDLLVHRLVRPDDRLTTRLSVVGVEKRAPGAYQVTRLDTTDATGAAVCTTWMGSLYRGVDVDGPERPPTDVPPSPAPQAAIPAGQLDTEQRVAIAANAAHVYTECARIWNPIHTDRSFAAAAGLPDIILHGTATLALAVSRVVEVAAEGDPSRVRRIGGRFGAMVRMPSELTVRLARSADNAVRFEVINQDGAPAVRDGFVVLS